MAGWVKAFAGSLGLLAACFVLAPRPAHACSCSGGASAYLSFPRDGAIDVATDTPIVLERYFLDGDPDTIGIALLDPDGTAVPLVETRRLAPPWSGCGHGELLFLRPAAPLAAGTTYTLQFSNVEEGATAASFSVGSSAFPLEELTPAVTYLAVWHSAGCITASCPGLAELHVDLGEAFELEHPLWLRVRSSAVESGTNQGQLFPENWFEEGSGFDPPAARSRQLSVALTPDDPCVDVEVIGVEGRALFEERRCVPDRCAVFGLISSTDCGDPPSSGVDAARIAGGTCDDPPVLEVRTGEGIVYPEPVSGAAGSSAGPPVANAPLEPDSGVPGSASGGETPPGETDQGEIRTASAGCGCRLGAGPLAPGASFAELLGFSLGLSLGLRARRRFR